MTEKIQDQISAFADDELSAEECEFLVRRLERDPDFRQKASSYAVIGAALRGEVLNPDPNVLRRRIQAELGGIAAPTRKLPLSGGAAATGFARPVLGLGIAATVAVVALLVLSGLNQPPGAVGPVGLIARNASGAADAGETISYVVPQDVTGSPLAGDQSPGVPIRLTNYLVTHGEYASGIGRTSIHTNVVGNQGNWVVLTQPPEQE